MQICQRHIRKIQTPLISAYLIKLIRLSCIF